MSTLLARAKCGCSEEVHQHSLYPSRVFPSPLSRHEHTLQWCFLHPIPTGLVHLCRFLPLSDTKVVLPQEEGEVGLKVFPQFQEDLWQSSEEEHHLSDPISLSILLLAPQPHQEEGTQMEGGSGFHQAFKFYKMQITPVLSQNVSWSRKHRSWLKDMTISGSNRPEDKKGGKYRWSSRQMPPFKRNLPGELSRLYQ